MTFEQEPVPTPRSGVERCVVGEHEVLHTPTSAHFGEMSWPTIGKRLLSLQWRLRYLPMEAISRSDLLHAASILCAYRELVLKTTQPRSVIVKVLRSIDDVSPGWHPNEVEIAPSQAGEP